MDVQSFTLPDIIDSSTLSSFRACRRKYLWSTLNSLTPIGSSVHLIAGAAFAAGLEAARIAAFSTEKELSVEEMLEIAFPPFIKEWGTFQPGEKDKKTKESMFAALRAYLTEFHPRRDVIQPVIKADGKPAVEFTFSIPLPINHPDTGNPLLFAGRFDMLAHYNNVLAIVDEKTTSQLGFSWAQQWSLRGQFMGYNWACRELGVPVQMTVIRGIGIYVRDVKFQTVIEQYPDYLLDRWYNQLLHDAKQIVYFYKSIKDEPSLVDTFYPFNYGDACTSYGGCSFTSLCQVRDPEPFFSNFSKYRWNPLAKIPIEEDETKPALEASKESVFDL